MPCGVFVQNLFHHVVETTRMYLFICRKPGTSDSELASRKNKVYKRMLEISSNLPPSYPVDSVVQVIQRTVHNVSNTHFAFPTNKEVAKTALAITSSQSNGAFYSEVIFICGLVYSFWVSRIVTSMACTHI